MSANQRGCLTLLGALVFGIIFCVGIPFILLPGLNVAVTLPIITVPGEKFVEDYWLTNTVIGMLMADVIVLIIVFWSRSKSNGWTKEVPGRYQGMVEVLTEGLWGLTKQMAPNIPKVRNILFPLMATMFIFLLAANWGKLLPGVESVGFIHCLGLHEGFNGFPRDPAVLGGYQLRVEGPIETGIPADYADYRQCNSFKNPTSSTYGPYLPRELDPFLDEPVVHTVQEGDTLASIAELYSEEVEDITSSPPNYDEGMPEGYEYTGWADPEISVESILSTNETLGRTIVFASGLEDHGEETSAGVDALEESAAEGELAEGEGETIAEAEVALEAELLLEPGQELLVREELYGEAATTRSNQLYGVTPWFRGAATDLNLTIGLALVAFVAIQAFGISELGLNYFQKFINVHAIGTVSKNPLGVIDFIAGLFEIVSEIGKVVSLSFRLFGAIFAGGLLYAVFLFLFGTVTPVVILLLEVIVGGAQAGVFAVLTLIFCAQAMVSHVHDEEHGEAHH